MHDLERMGRRLQRGAERIVKQTLRDLKVEAVKRTSGTANPKTQRAGRRASRPQDPDLVNRQTGALAGAWETEGPAWEGGTLAGSLWNSDPKAELLEAGTETMFARRPHEAAAAAVEPRFLARMEALVDDL